MKLYVSEPSERHAGPILLCDSDDHNDIAEFFHNEHATVSQSYETALALAHALVEASAPKANKLDIDTASLEAALKVSELFAQNHNGGDVQRTARVQCVIADAINTVCRSARNDGILAAAEECAKRGRATILDAEKIDAGPEHERLVTAAFHFWRCSAHIEKLQSVESAQPQSHDEPASPKPSQEA